MRKLKLRLDELKEEMELLDLEDLNGFKGGTGDYYGYPTWDAFVDAASQGLVPDGVYFDDGVSGGPGVHGPDWMYQYGGGGYGQYGQYGYGDYDWIQYCNEYSGQSTTIGDTSQAAQDRRYNGWCGFYALHDAMSGLGYTKSFGDIKEDYMDKYNLSDVGQPMTQGSNAAKEYIIAGFNGFATGAQFKEFAFHEAGKDANQNSNAKGYYVKPPGTITTPLYDVPWSAIAADAKKADTDVKVIGTIGTGNSGHAVEITDVTIIGGNITIFYKDSVTGEQKMGNASVIGIDPESIVAIKKKTVSW